MYEEVFEILDSGLGATLQDCGRAGWRRFGVPPGGAMDDHAATWANRLLDNPASAPLVELMLQGAKIRVLRSTWIAITGADAKATVPTWRVVRVEKADNIHFPSNQSGVWTYLAVEGGFSASRLLGSASAYPRGGLGRPLAKGEILSRLAGDRFHLPTGVAGRAVDWHEIRHYDAPPSVRVWRGPQWDSFSETDRQLFFETDWTVSSQSDRVGYRLTGKPLKPSSDQIISEAVLVGSIQIPANGLPIVTMRDGPTVGGYPKLGIVDGRDLAWIAQSRPGTRLRFRLILLKWI
jgi:biotin-dependent carboxylase-like uncharacterized protein